MKELAKRDYSEYIEYVHEGRYIHGRFTKYLTRLIQDFIETKTGNAYDILLLSVPPQHGKSTTITETLPSWYLGKFPTNRVIEISYNDDFAKLFTRRNREKIEHFGKDLFDVTIGSPNTSNEFVLSNNIGSFISRGVMSGVTGRPCELMIIDDPIKNRQEADSQTIRDNIWDEWWNSYKTRLAPNAKVIIIQTRWHKEDLYGKVMVTERNVTRVNFPIECEEDRDILGRSLGDPLFPEMGKDKKWLEDFKISYQNSDGTRAWNALYRGQPTDEEGGIFKRDWWKYYTELPEYAYKVISVDANFKEGNKSDNVAIQVWVKLDSNMYLVEKFKKAIGFVDTIDVLNKIISRNMDYNVIYIEDKANGSAIIDVLTRRYSAVVPVNPEGGKEARAYAVSPMLESGSIYIKKEHYDLVEECSDFPNSEHDDQVDAMTQALNKLRNIVAVKHIIDKDRYNEDDQLEELLSFKG